MIVRLAALRTADVLATSGGRGITAIPHRHRAAQKAGTYGIRAYILC
jgi:hypothetical protein